MADHVYNTDFYDYIDEGSRASARIVTSLLLDQLRVNSVLDVGAGHGAWAAEWMAAGVKDIVAIDGDYVRRDQLVIPGDVFQSHDLKQPLRLDRTFDLIQSLEVAEHLPQGTAMTFVESLTRHGDIVMFSAAVPNQGGEHHVNEQPPEFWRLMFMSQGYHAFNWLQPRLAKLRQVKPWYRYNSMLYVNETGQRRLTDEILATRVPDNEHLTAGGDLAWRARRTMVRLLPPALVKPVAMAKASVEARLRGRSGAA